MAQSVYWTGAAGTGNWGTAANWDSNPALPAGSDVLGFDAAAAGGEYVIALGANRSVAGLVFEVTGADSFLFSAGSVLTIGTTGIVNENALTQTFDVTVATSGTTTWATTTGALDFADVRVASNLTLSGSHGVTIDGILTNWGGSRRITNDDSGGLLLNAVELSDNNTSRTLTIQGTGDTVVAGVISDGGTGAGNLTKSGTGTLTLNSANTFTGTARLSAGTTIAGNDAAFGTGTLQLSGGTLSGDGSPRVFANDVLLSGNFTLGGSSDLELAGTLTLSANRTLTISNTGSNLIGDVALANSATNRQLTITGVGDVTIAGEISDGLASAGRLRKTGSGTLTLSGNNTYSGVTTLSGGTVVAASDTAFGDGSLTLGSVRLQGAGGARTIANDGLFTGTTEIAGSSVMEFTGAYTVSGGNRTLNITNTASTLFSGNIALSENATNRLLTITGTGDIELSGDISNGAATAARLRKLGTGTLTLSGDNTHAGLNTISDGTVVIASDTAFGTGEISLGAATLQGDGVIRNIGNIITLAGSATFGGSSDLNVTGTLSASSNRTLTVGNTAQTTLTNVNLSTTATNRTLTLAGAGDLTIAGIVSNGTGGSVASNLTMNGSGTVTLAGSNTYGGTTRINSGTLSISDETGLGSNPASFNSGRLTLDGGTLRTTASFAIDDANRGVALQAGGGTFETDPATTLTIANVVSGTGAFTKTGSGQLTLSGTNTYSGATT
ncbi:MAG: autotransporter-associated beta strand repeat-containing protein, partial [Cephaloticoccus sp.]|nr:autotransporter-associated beta strand repeat-containing protein [Cephaloticoccus sp.]